MAKKLERARVHVHASFNNTIITLTDLDGSVLAWISAGCVGFKGSRKGTPYAAQVATDRLIGKLREFGIKSLVITINGAGPGRHSVTQTLKGAGIRIEEIKNVTPVAHS